MQIPSVERTANLRPGGADVVVPAAARVIPVAPVNPPAPEKPASVAGVVNEINPALRARPAEQSAAVQVSVPDPLRGGAQADNTQRNWTERQPAPEKVQELPREPISKMLIEQINALWAASAKAVEAWYLNSQQQNQNPVQIQNLAQTRNQSPAQVPGVLAKEALTYTPSKIKKNESTERSDRSDPST